MCDRERERERQCVRKNSYSNGNGQSRYQSEFKDKVQRTGQMFKVKKHQYQEEII